MSNELMEKVVLMVAGGTGGHIFPGLAIANELRELNIKVIWLGTKKGMEHKIVPEHQFEMEHLEMSGIRGKGLTAILLMPFKLSQAMLQAYKVIKKTNPDLVVAMGGFVSAPAGLMARLMGKSLIIHEQNAIAGLSNRLLNLVANKTLCAFPQAIVNFYRKNSVGIMGNPLRKEIIDVAKASVISKDKTHTNVLILGGSLGAKKLNELLPVAISQFLKQQPQLEKQQDTAITYSVHHQCGAGKSAELNASVATLELNKIQTDGQSISYKVDEFIDDMAKAYLWADVVICRAGALTISELCAVGLPAILIPYPYAVDDHQTANAHYMVENDAAFCVDEKELTIEKMMHLLTLLNPQKIVQMSNKAKKIGRPEATNLVVKDCLATLTNFDQLDKRD